MKVAVVCPYAFDSPGGVQDQVRRIVSWLCDEGHVAWAVAPGEGGPPGTRSVGGFQEIRANRSRAPITLDPRAASAVAKATAEADVVHVHEPFMPVVGPAAVLGSGPPVVGTFHADPSRLVRAVYKGTAGLLRRVVDRMSAVTAVSPVAASAVEHLTDLQVVPNGIDLEMYAPGVDRVPGRVVFLGRDDPRKGLDVLLQGWPLVMSEQPDASLVVVGAERESGPAGVRFAGRLSEEEKISELGAATTLVAPNLGGESFGIVVLEGMAAGCAIVASDIPAFRHVAGDAARFAPPGDPTALAEAIASTLTEPGLAASMAARGGLQAKRFGRDAVLGGYLDAYRTGTAGA